MNHAQSTSHLLMIRPASFRKNEETAANNHYQRESEHDDVAQRAMDEFDAFVEELRRHDVNVLVVDDVPEANTPDALFPNNWVSFHDDGRVALYPMFAPNRRAERREDILHDLAHTHGFGITEIVDFTEFEAHQAFMEGTGSMVLDRIHGKAYAALSPRTDRDAFAQVCDVLDLEGVVFEAFQTVGTDRLPIYHTNVMMAVGTGWAAVCLDCVDHPEDRELLEQSLREDGLVLVELTESQLGEFAGNMLEVTNTRGETLIVMSERARRALTDTQRTTLATFGTLVSSDLRVIETCGGGSARCMMAEIHLPTSQESAT